MRLLFLNPRDGAAPLATLVPKIFSILAISSAVMI